MENASRALIMAGSILIALMIIAALLLMFNNLTTYQREETQTAREAQVIEFNNQFSTYNKEKVRGSDLYSLLNKVIDYNRRKSTAGTGTNDEGQYLAYQEMKITFSINKSDLRLDDKNRLFMRDNYTVGGNKNDFDTIRLDIKSLENDEIVSNFKYNEKILQGLCTGVTKVFIDEPTGTEEQIKNKKITAFMNFNNICGSTVLKYGDDNEIARSWDLIKKGSTARENVYKYYEYIQFKRAIFECTDAQYNDKTGRIISMNFRFTGNFQ